jgi:hypothetical protein
MNPRAFGKVGAMSPIMNGQQLEEAMLGGTLAGKTSDHFFDKSRCLWPEESWKL